MSKPFDIKMTFPFLWIIGWLAASIIYRKMKGKPIFYQKPASVRFRQGNASGNSHRSWYTRIGGARNCLVVQVTDDELDIHPFPPFNLLFLPEIYGLEHRVSLKNIMSAKIEKRLFWRRVDLEFKTSEGKVEGVSLLLKNPEEFLDAIGCLLGKDDQLSIKRSGVITAKPIGPRA